MANHHSRLTVAACRRGNVLWAALLLTACGSGGTTPTPAEEVQRVLDFAADAQQVEAIFADYPAADAAQFALEGGWEAVPGLRGQNGYFLNGRNRSDDLFMAVRRRLDGLQPQTRYMAEFTLTLATREGSGCVGIGGAPGESVYIKAGLTTQPPRAEEDASGDLRMTIDKGNQATGGSDALVLGNLAGPTSACDQSRYALKTLSSAGQSFAATSDAQGALWLIVGSDSGFEGETRFYFTRIEVQLTPRP